MEIYLISIVTIIIIFGIMKYKKIDEEEITNKIFMISFIVLVLIYGLRGRNVGTDTNVYLDLYNHIGEMPIKDIFSVWTEVGYNIWNKILYLPGGIEQVLLFANGIFIIGSTIYFIYKNSLNKLFSLYLYVSFMFYFSSMNVMRQFIAIGIVFLALNFLFENKNKKFFILIFIAMLFHKSAIINLIFYFLKKINLTPKKMLVILISIFIIIKANIINLIVSYTSFGHYLETVLGENGNWSHFIVYATIMAFIVIVDILIDKGKIKQNTINQQNKDKENILYWAIFISVLTELCATKILMFGRVSMYFMPFVIIGIPNAINKIEDKKIRKILSILIIIATVGYMSLYMIKGGQGVIPYKLFWQ